MNRVGDDAVTRRLFFRIQFGRGSERFTILPLHDQPAFLVGRNAAGDDHADPARSALCVKRGHAL